MNFFIRVLAALLLGAMAAGAAAQGALEKTKVHIAVGGKSGLYYLPIVLTEQLGYFKDEGLEVKTSDFPGGAKALQAVVGGSADVVAGAYEHTINMQARGQVFTAFVLQGVAPQISVGVAKAKAAAYKGPADLKGMKVGVSAPGSSTNMVVNHLLSQGGLKPGDVSIIGTGSGASAVAAIKSGGVDAMSNTDPAMTKLEREGDIVIVATTRTPEGTRQLFGGPMPAGCLYAPESFLKANPNTVQALANAMVRTLKWLQKATPAQIAATVPEAYLLGDKALYMEAVERVRRAYSTDGLIPEDGAANILHVLAAESAEVKNANIKLGQTYTNEFAQKANQKYR